MIVLNVVHPFVVGKKDLNLNAYTMEIIKYVMTIIKCDKFILNN